MNSYLLRASYENNVKKFIFFSCTVMYPSSEKKLTEKDLDENKDIFKNYFGVGNTKMYVEKMCKFYSSLNRTKHYAIRHSNIFGPHDKFDLKKSHFVGATINKIFHAKKEIKLWGDGKEKRDFLYVDDLIYFLEKILIYNKTDFEIFNCSYEKSFSIEQMLKKIIKLSGKKINIIKDKNKPTIKININVSSSKAKKILGWKSRINIDDALRRTMTWYRKNELGK